MLKLVRQETPPSLLAGTNSEVKRPTIGGLPTWACLPELPAVTVPGTRTWYSSDPAEEIDLGKMSCTCNRWVQDARSSAHKRSIGRCCDHMVRVVLAQIQTSGVEVDPWLTCILRSCWKEYAPPPIFEWRFFSNGKDQFLALYGIERGYVQLYCQAGEPFQWGYDSSQNRWAHGVGPENPLAIKRDMRPWVKALDRKYGHL